MSSTCTLLADTGCTVRTTKGQEKKTYYRGRYYEVSVIAELTTLKSGYQDRYLTRSVFWSDTARWYGRNTGSKFYHRDEYNTHYPTSEVTRILYNDRYFYPQ